MSTCNFYSFNNLPLLVFMTYDEVYSQAESDSEYPQEDDFQDDDTFEIDYNAYEKAKDSFLEKYFEKQNCCILDEQDVLDLKDDLDNFNSKLKSIAYRLYESKRKIDYYEYCNLIDIEIEIKNGYYSSAQLYVNERYFECLNKTHKNIINKFFNDMKKKYKLTKLNVSYRFSNGEAGYCLAK